MTNKEKLRDIIFEAETPAGKAFDILLLILIVVSIILVSLEIVHAIGDQCGDVFYSLDWIVTIFFTAEYLLRIYVVESKKQYIFSFYGIIDLLSVLPTYLSLFFFGAQSLTVVRVFRLLRIFRILKLGRFVGEAQELRMAIRRSRPKITVFVGGVLSIVVVMGAVMYIIEGEEHGFTSIPKSMYWAVVTMTTVGFGDITPKTPLGQMIASGLMIMGYGILAVPTGIVSVELSQASQDRRCNTINCYECGLEGHELDAKFCRDCGATLHHNAPDNDNS